MKTRPIAMSACAVLLLLAGCQKKETPVAVAAPPKPQTVNLVSQPERSRHFEAVHRQLELGGTLYGYADIDGDIFKLADGLQPVLEQLVVAQPQLAPLVKQDYRALFAELGLGDIKAVGLSSVPEGNGYFRNRVFFFTPEGRHGLLAGLGGAPAPFAKLKLAPVGTDLYSEAEVDLAEVYKAVKAVVKKVGGDTTANLMEEKIREAGEKAAISLLGFMNDWKGHTATVVRFDPEQNLTLPGVVLPRPSILICVDGLAPTLEPLLKKTQALKVKVEGSRQVYSLAQPSPLPGMDPVIVLDGTTFYFATSPAFLEECLSNQSGLGQTPEFQKALGHVSATGNGLLYASPRLFERVHDLERLNPNFPPQFKQTLQLILRNVPQPTQPLVSVRTNLPDGILVQSYWNRSLKQDVATIAIYNPVSIGLLAAMAIPAFEKVRTTSQEKAILNNLRQLAAASDQYYLEHGVDTVVFDQLVGPDKYVRRITEVAGENYRNILFKQGVPLIVRTANGRVMQYPDLRGGAPRARAERVEVQLLELEASAPTRLKVEKESDRSIMFEGTIPPNLPMTFKKVGRVLITVETGLNLQVRVNGKNYPVPFESYGRFVID